MYLVHMYSIIKRTYTNCKVLFLKFIYCTKITKIRIDTGKEEEQSFL